MRKRLLCIIMSALMMAAMFSGCGSSDADETTKGTTKAVETEKEKTTEEKNTKTETDKETETDSDSDDEEKKYAKADGDLIYWSMWNSDDPQAKAIQKVIDAYEEASGNTVKVKWKGSDIKKTLQDQLDTGKGIDLFDEDYYRVARSYADSFLDLTDMAEEADYESKSRKVIVDALIEEAGSLKGIPYQSYTSGIFYNKAIFEEAGIEKEPKTWEEFLDICEKIKEAGYSPLALDDKYVLYNYGYHLARHIGQDKVKELCKKGGWKDSEEALKAAEDMAYLVEKGYIDGNKPGTYPASENTIGYNETAMIVMTSAVPNRIQKNTEAEIEWGMFNYPTVEDGKDKQTVANIGGRAFAISKDSKNAEAAFDLIMMITTGEYDQEIALASDSIPADPTNKEWPEILPCKKELEGLTGTYEGNMGLNTNSDFKNVLKDLLLELFEGKLSPKKFISEADASFKD